MNQYTQALALKLLSPHLIFSASHKVEIPRLVNAAHIFEALTYVHHLPDVVAVFVFLLYLGCEPHKIVE